MQFEVGVNSRHFDAVGGERTAFSSMSTSVAEPGQPETSAVTTSLRFTGNMAFHTFLGVEAEVGEMVGLAGSNVAGAYAVAGARGEFGRLRGAAEVVAGQRWIRYALDDGEDLSRTLIEPRIRGDVWIRPRLTVGAAVGTTLGEQQVWMAGVYLGVHSADFDRH